MDWGQTFQNSKDDKDIKKYFIAFVLSHSRQKYMVWQQRPFTTAETIQCHEAAFEYYSGMAEEIVYDQGNLIAVNENAGDLILTNDFKSYVKESLVVTYVGMACDPE